MKWLSALISVPLNPEPFVHARETQSATRMYGVMWYVRSAHHAGAGKHGVIDRIGADEAIVLDEFHLDDSKVVNMLEIITNTLLSVVGATTPDNHVAGDSMGNLLCQMRTEFKLSVSPLDADLLLIRDRKSVV